jgi:hypothetical protein
MDSEETHAMRSELRLLISLLLLLVAAGWSRAEEWGNLRGQVVFDGDPPVPKKLQITKDEEECCKHNLVDESIWVNSSSRGLKNVVIYLYPAPDQKVPIHPSYEALEQAEQELDNSACRFAPRVVLLRTKQTLVIGNSDPIGHNVMIDTQKNPPMNVTIPSGGSLKKSFEMEERSPVSVSCSIHPWMRGWLLIRDHPYMAVTDENGAFEIQNLPVGTWEFVFWHERPKFLTDVTVGGQRKEWRRGRAQLTIQSGDMDLGVVKVAAEHFK